MTAGMMLVEGGMALAAWSDGQMGRLLEPCIKEVTIGVLGPTLASGRFVDSALGY